MYECQTCRWKNEDGKPCSGIIKTQGKGCGGWRLWMEGDE